MKNEKNQEKCFFLQKNDEELTESIQFFSNSFYSMCIRRYDVYSIDFHRYKFNKWSKNDKKYVFLGSLGLKFFN